MRGSLKRVGENRWRLTYDLKSTGKRRQRVVRFTGNKRQAEAKLAELVSQARGGLTGTKQNVNQFLAGWIESRALAATTITNYRDYARLYIVPNIGHIPLEQLAAEDIFKLYAGLLKSGGRNGSPISARVVRNVHGLLNSALADATMMGLLPFNPASRVRSPGQAQSPKPDVLEPDRLRACVEALQKTPYGFLAWLAALTGLRRGELLGLRGGDLLIDDGLVHVRHSKDRFGNLKSPKNGKPRLVPLPLDVHSRRKIEDYMRNRIGHEDFLFDFPAGSLSGCFREACARVGFPGVHLHTFRHSVASILMKKGVHPKAIQELLGHHDVRFTMSQYSHLLPGVFEESTRPLGDLLRDQNVIAEPEKQPDRAEDRAEPDT